MLHKIWCPTSSHPLVGSGYSSSTSWAVSPSEPPKYGTAYRNSNCYQHCTMKREHVTAHSSGSRIATRIDVYPSESGASLSRNAIRFFFFLDNALKQTTNVSFLKPCNSFRSKSSGILHRVERGRYRRHLRGHAIQALVLDYLTLKMETSRSAETSVNIHQMTRRNT
jgi:hypothetical protein